MIGQKFISPIEMVRESARGIIGLVFSLMTILDHLSSKMVDHWLDHIKTLKKDISQTKRNSYKMITPWDNHAHKREYPKALVPPR